MFTVPLIMMMSLEKEVLLAVLLLGVLCEMSKMQGYYSRNQPVFISTIGCMDIEYFPDQHLKGCAASCLTLGTEGASVVCVAFNYRKDETCELCLHCTYSMFGGTMYWSGPPTNVYQISRAELAQGKFVTN